MLTLITLISLKPPIRPANFKRESTRLLALPKAKVERLRDSETIQYSLLKNHIDEISERSTLVESPCSAIQPFFSEMESINTKLNYNYDVTVLLLSALRYLANC